jgi:hypothetical protein
MQRRSKPFESKMADDALAEIVHVDEKRRSDKGRAS